MWTMLVKLKIVRDDYSHYQQGELEIHCGKGKSLLQRLSSFSEPH